MSINSDYAEPCRTGGPRIAVLMCYLADAGLCGALDVPDLELEKPEFFLVGSCRLTDFKTIASMT
jgi:hypothetical protein